MKMKKVKKAKKVKVAKAAKELHQLKAVKNQPKAAATHQRNNSEIKLIKITSTLRNGGAFFILGTGDAVRGTGQFRDLISDI